MEMTGPTTRMKKSEHRVALACVAAVLVLAACSPPTASTTHGRGAKAAQVQRAANPPSALDPDLVNAVGLGKDAGPVELKFALRQKLTPNQPGTLDVAILPTTNVERLTVSFRSDEGLSVSEGAHVDPIDRPEPNVPIAHSVTVVADRDGIFNLTATVLIDTDTESTARAFSIPLIAGSGLKAADK
jgi:hypothetical protein